ncbi:hypothetical protein AeMF1_007336 [Aphanomyces euteiches]|nr:hypothetical protein AeMF1_007336 [Aphanomyces euteiches]
MESDADAILQVISLVCNAVAVLEIDSDSDDEHSREQRFVRPTTAFMEFLDMQDVLLHGGESFYFDNFRLPRVAIDLLVDVCRPFIPVRMETKCVLLVTLQYLATGSTVRLQEQLFQRQSFSQISIYRRIGIRAIIQALCKHEFYGIDPHEKDRMATSSLAFARKHPLLSKCLGAIDGTHIQITVSSDLVDRFRNRKTQTSTNVLGIVDECGRFLAVYAGAEGCASDSFVLDHSGFEQNIPLGYFYLADAGYRLSNTILTPYRSQRYHLREWADDPADRPSNEKELYNYYHSMTRIVVERAFGIWKMKWKVLSSGLNLPMDRIVQVVHACAALHNFAIAFNPAFIYEIDDIDLQSFQDELLELHEGAIDTPLIQSEHWRNSIAEEMWNAYQYEPM